MSTNPIPEHAKKVFKGKIFEVWQWEQKMFDGSTKTFEQLKRPDTAQVIAVVGDKILMQIESQPHRKESFPSIPGGRVEEGEEALQAAKRELTEETGYASSEWVLWRTISPMVKIEWTVFTYIARNCTPEKAVSPDAGEKMETRLVDFEEFMTVATEDPLFYSPEMVPDLLRMRLDSKKKEEFRTLLFGK